MMDVHQHTFLMSMMICEIGELGNLDVGQYTFAMSIMIFKTGEPRCDVDGRPLAHLPGIDDYL